MKSSLSVPTTKTPTKTTSRDERVRCHTLYFDAGWTQDQIALQLNLTRRQVQHALATRLTPQHHLRGRRAYLNTPQRKRLIEWVTSSKANRRTPWAKVPPILRWDVSVFAIRTAFKKEGYTRRVARRKPGLDYLNQIARLQ
ncbi:uncharacterized protein RAG0_03167 [Rhynchosporium agropyri]|uniref:Transposase Tc1-like domain-containing protein n=1 Tax=Rhynchosporium agropyri TaxID=914238 RepID=A0A1E1K7H3_9HELO|nr:uncharacterized protein RAG0_03167 [Rhynchosporium agropyri]